MKLVTGDFTLHSGSKSNFKIDCDDLDDSELEVIAQIAAPLMPAFSSVEGVPTGGLRLAEKFVPYIDPESNIILIVDDVLTTGVSMETQRADRKAVGFVLFSRSLEWPGWISPFFVHYLQPKLFEFVDQNV